MSPNLDLKLGIKPKAGNFLFGKREGGGGGGRETEIGRQIDKERFKTERGRQKSNRDKDLVKRCVIASMHFREMEGEREVRSNLGISFLQRGMERDMGEVGLGQTWFMCLIY